jgi:hypothetical protein
MGKKKSSELFFRFGLARKLSSERGIEKSEENSAPVRYRTPRCRFRLLVFTILQKAPA